jgi:E3 ubiquitin-protein ligase RNF14
MIDCGHVFCVECLQDFYNNAIKEGDLTFVRCLDPDCAKKRIAAQAASKKKRKVKTQLSPSELLQIPLEPEIVARYVKLKRKAALESDKNTIYCPRSWCQGAARSKKHKKSVGPEADDSSDEEGENDDQAPKAPKFVAGTDLLSVCEDCSYAFCSRCYQGWHGEFTICIPKTATGELTEEDKASLAYLKKHSTPCPTCAAPAQKTHGCNHMICFTCRSHFCYLCSSWLSPSNPYAHYNQEGAPCHMRLWEGEEGDGENEGPGFAERPVEIPQEDILVIPEDGPEIAVAPEPINPQPVIQLPQEPLQREGPLVLRINQLPPQPVPPPALVAPQGQRNAGRNRQAQPRQPQRGNGRGGAQGRGGNARNRVPRNQPQPELDPHGQEAAQQAWVQMFVQMAMNDEEDQLDSDDEADGRQWEIPVR